VVLLGLGFFILYVPYATSRTLSTNIMKQEHYDKLGFYSLASCFISLGTCSLFSGVLVLKLGDRLSMFLGVLCQAIYIASFILPLELREDPENDWLSNVVVLLGAAFGGFGECIIWVTGLSYISRCAGDDNKGRFNGIFLAIYMQ
jgi:MFS family permease